MWSINNILMLLYYLDALRAHFHTKRRKSNSIADGSRDTILQRERRRSRRVKVHMACGAPAHLVTKLKQQIQ